MRRRSKYGVAPAQERTLDGIRFDSKREMQRYSELKLLLRAGVIRELELQPEFPCKVNGTLVCRYYADFC